MEKKNETIPEKELSISISLNPFKLYEKLISGLERCGRAVQKFCDKISHGRFAAIGLPLAIPTRAAADAFANAEKTEAAGMLTGMMGGLVAGTFQSLSLAISSGFLPAKATSLLVVGKSVLTAGAGLTAGAIVGPLLVIPALTATWGLARAIKSLPKAIINIPTGFRRSQQALNSQTDEPVVINPTPDRGIEPDALPQPSTVLLKLASPATAFSDAGTTPKETAARQETGAPQPKHGLGL